jgi:hypothetical protein
VNNRARKIARPLTLWFLRGLNVMGDCELIGKKDCVEKKTVESCASLSREVESAQFSTLRPAAVMSVGETGTIDFAQSDAVEAKLRAVEEQKKCMAASNRYENNTSNLARIESASTGAHLGHVAPDHVFSYDPVGSSAGQMMARPVESQAQGLGFPASLDFGKEDVWGKKPFDKKLYGDKLFKKDLDYAPVQTLYPVASQLLERVDKNQDGTMSNREITNGLNGDKLNEKEKHMLEMIKKNKDLIDTDNNGISMRDIKEFDAKVVQYNNELAMSRKFAPELAELARQLHQRGKLIDDNHDGRFSKEEMQSFYMQCKKEFLWKPTEEGKRELQALGWGIANFDRFALLAGRQGGGQISLQSIRSEALRELDRGAPGQFRENFLSASDRARVERYHQSR